MRRAPDGADAGFGSGSAVHALRIASHLLSPVYTNSESALALAVAEADEDAATAAEAVAAAAARCITSSATLALWASADWAGSAVMAAAGSFFFFDPRFQDNWFIMKQMSMFGMGTWGGAWRARGCAECRCTAEVALDEEAL